MLPITEALFLKIYSHLTISLTTWVRSENSSDLGSGLRPVVRESDEISDLTHVVVVLDLVRY